MGFFGKLTRRSYPKTVIIGLDGVPYSLLSDLISKGYLKNIASILQNGYFGRMEVCLPEISSVSWSSFMTGTQPGEHGIFGFSDLEPGTYKLTFPNFLDLRAKTLFDEIGRLGLRSVIINLPSTYPAREMEGILISGFVAIDLKRAVYPQSLLTKLKQFGYAIDIDISKARNDHDFLISDLYRVLDIRWQVTDYLWSSEKWHLFMVVITGTDRLNHFLWKAYEDEHNPWHRNFIKYYQKLDDVVGKIYEKFTDLDGSKNNENHLMMLSDHGFEGIRSEVYLNCWLQDNGFLFFESEAPNSLEGISLKSSAFAMDPSRIYINTKGRYPKGRVEQGDVTRVKSELRKGLRDIRYEDGSPVVRTILDRDELYHGLCTSQGPDLVLLANSGFDLKGRLNSPHIFNTTVLQGKHTHDDAFIFSSKGKRAETIFECKKLILEEYSC